MINVGDHGLICLGEGSYAAVPLAMQSNAVAINAALVADQASFATYGNRYVRKFVTTSTTSGGANSGVVLYDGTAGLSVINGAVGVLPRGWYAASASMTYQETGAVTVNTYRRSIIQINQGATAFPPTFFQATTSASNTGSADSMTVNGWFYSDQTVTTTVGVFFGHGNTGSSMTVAVGAVLTIRFLTTGLVV